MALCSAIACALARLIPGAGWQPVAAPGLASVLLLAGIALNLLPKFSFRRVATSVNPLRPQIATQLVKTGLYRHSRNPMYLGHALMLLAMALLQNPAAPLLVPIFIAYITRFQIQPEERALRQRFGKQYEDYCARVRRWL